jgi:hypothetical protein
MNGEQWECEANIYIYVCKGEEEEEEEEEECTRLEEDMPWFLDPAVRLIVRFPCTPLTH